jgi:flagellar P-ring protein precursor FlgI
MRVISIILVVLFASPAYAVRIADITRLDGQRENVLTGVGLVFGLKGTGDGGDYMPAIRPLAEMLSRFSNAASLSELSNAKNVAVVSITARVPATGARQGDRIDLHVTSIGKSSSLKGGRLFVSPMTGPIPGGGIYALAEGPLITEDSSSPTVATVRGGATMEVDLLVNPVRNGRFTLILDDPSASWQMASLVAKVINDMEDGSILAVAVDPKNIVVSIPQAELARPDAFIARVMHLQLPRVMTEARITVNERTGTLIISGDVEISPVIISHKGLTISTITPPPVATPRTPVVEQRDFVAMDPLNQGGAKLRDLLTALDQLKVPATDRIYIIKQLHETGKLHAKLIVE